MKNGTKQIITNLKGICCNYTTQVVVKSIAFEGKNNSIILKYNEIDSFEIFDNIKEFEKSCTILERL